MKNLIATILILLANLNYAQFDLAVSPSVNAPVSGCQLTNSEAVTITIVNSTTSWYSGNFDVSYTINGGIPVVETVNATMPGNGTYIYTFTANADLSACNQYVFDFNVTDPLDVNPSNDNQSITIESDCYATAGTWINPGQQCAGTNSANIEMTGYTGTIAYWESSTDGINWSNIPNPNPIQNFTNINSDTWYQVTLNSPYGYCSPVTTPFEIVSVDQPSVGGAVGSNLAVCDNGNSGVLTLSGETGNIIDWESSTDGGLTWNPLGHTGNVYPFNNLTQTTLFIAIVQNGVCPSINSSDATVTLIPGSEGGNLIGSNSVCYGDNDSLIALSGFNGAIQDWISSTDNGNTWSSIGNILPTLSYQNLTTTTLYQVIVQSGSCPQDSSSIATVVVNPNPIIDAGPDVTINEDDSTTLLATGGVTYSWTPNTDIITDTSASPIVFPLTNTIYVVEAWDVNGCYGTDTVLVGVIPDTELPVISTAITPNGDGYNDTWIITKIEDYPEAEVFIFNGYGQMLYQSNSYNNDWDGRHNGEPLPDGTYYFAVKLSDNHEMVKGHLTLISND